MKPTVDQKLNQIFDVIPSSVELSPTSSLAKEERHVDDDYEYARKNLRTLIDSGKDAMENLTFLAKEGESPRIYEVLGQLIKTLADTNKDLLDLSKKAREAKGLKTSDEQKPQNVTNALFVGSTAELQKLIKGNE
jgi:Terminase DNA packaging enzyme